MKTLTLLSLIGILAISAAAMVLARGQAGSTVEQTMEKPMSTEQREHQRAMFAGGCFWCMEKPFEQLKGVISVESGYAGGTTENPSYNDYSKHGHIEVIQVVYDPEQVGYRQLLDIFWQQINPTDDGGQFVDRGHAYTSGIFYYDDEQRQLAMASKVELAESGLFDRPIVTPIEPAATFYRAEEYHQDYYKKNPIRYGFYRANSGRDTFLKKIWGDDGKPPRSPKQSMNRENLKERLTPLQYKVTQEDGTEPAFNNRYWNNKKAGIYVDIVSGEPLFSSGDKFESGTGWPSFSKPLVRENIVEKKDRSFFMVRTEVRSRGADSHLGHVFEDGPAPTGLRYCINSAALRFVPVAELEGEGLAEYLSLFQ